MESRSNIEVVAQVYETASRGAADEMIALFDDDARIVLADALPYGGVYEGKQGVLQLGARLAEAWSDFRYEVLRYMEGGDYVTAIIELNSVARHSGKTVRMPIAEVFRLRNAKVIEIQAFYFDTASAATAFPRT